MSDRPRAAIALWIAVLVLCAVQVARTRFVADLSSFLPAAPTAEQRLLVEQLRDGAISRVMLLGIEGATPPLRSELSRSLAAALRGDPRFASIANGAGGSFERERDVLLAHRYALSPAVTPRRFTVEGLREAIGATVELLGSSAGMLLKPLVPRDPTGELLAVLDNIRPRGAPRSVEGTWASHDGARALLVARTRASGSDIDAQAAAIGAVERAFQRAAAALGLQAAGARLVMTGTGVFSARSRALVERDVVRLSTASLVAVAAILLAVYRSAAALLLGLVPVASGALVAVAAVSLGFGTVHGITLGFGTALIGEAVDYSIYLFVQAARGERTGDAAWRRGFWPTVRLGVLTSIAGFSALLFSGLPSLEQLGAYAIAGLLAAAAVTRFVLPALLPRSFRIRDVSAFGARLALGCESATRLRWAVFAVAVIAAGVVLAHRSALWDARLSSLNPIGERDRALDGALRADLGAADARYLIAVPAANDGAALEAAERVDTALDGLVAAGRLGGYDSPALLLPSPATQRARLASLPDGATLRERLHSALAGMPLRPDRLEPFVADVERERLAGPVTRADLAGTALDAALDGLLVSDGRGGRIAMIGLRAPAGQPLDATALRAAFESARAPGALLLDLRGEVDRLYAGYLQRALATSAVGLAVIVALLFAALRSARRVGRVLAPLAAAVLVIAAWHALAGTRLTILHLVGLLLVVAIGSNYALFFDRLRAHPDPAAAPRTLASLALANATTVVSFGMLALSSIPVLHAIGSTVALGAFLALAFSAALGGPAREAERRAA